MGPLIDTDVLFQSLLIGIAIPDATVRADLDVDSFDSVPFITHNSILTQTSNGPGLWACTLNVNAFIIASTANFQTVQALYAGIHAWGESPLAGTVPGVGAVETVEDIQAFTRQGQAEAMLNKVVTQYVGSFELSIRNH